MPAKRIYRNTREKVVGGVCAGIADYFDVDVAWIRLAFVLSVFASGFGLLAYVIAWIVFPKDERVPGHHPESATGSDVSATTSAPTSSGRTARKVASGSRNAIGILLVLLGVLFFMDQNFWWFRFDAFWPVILIGLGLYMVLRPLQSEPSEVPSDRHVAVATPNHASTDTSADSGRES
jgi:phage shock protein PspC (stress-responsive transcriptional regulator)